MPPARILVVYGTRPEAIKMAHLINLLKRRNDVVTRVCTTGQHREMLDQTLALFNLSPDYDLGVMRPDQDLTSLTARILESLRAVFDDFSPNYIVVHGDTTTTFGASLAAFYAKIPSAHVEAGLRTGDPQSPWPEEMNRKIAGALCTLHFAPTPRARQNLLAEGVSPSQIHVTGNTIVDAIQRIEMRVSECQGLDAQIGAKFSFLEPNRRMILVTAHRRENFEGGVERICSALANIAMRDDAQVVFPVHLNPNIRRVVYSALGSHANVQLLDPVDYLEFFYLMRRSHLILTDSGGIQEEAPSLGKPVLVMRDVTERPEAVEAGCARLVGNQTQRIQEAVETLLDDVEEYKSMVVEKNPYGDGQASERIVDKLVSVAIG